MSFWQFQPHWFNTVFDWWKDGFITDLTYTNAWNYVRPIEVLVDGLV